MNLHRTRTGLERGIVDPARDPRFYLTPLPRRTDTVWMRLRLVSSGLAALLLSACSAETPPAAAPMGTRSEGITATRPFVVQLQPPQSLSLRDGEPWNAAIRSAQDAAILCGAIPEERVETRLRAVPAFHATLTDEERSALLHCPGVVAITEDRANEPSLVQSLPIISARAAAFGGSYGAGQRVAVLDTGWFSTATELSPKVVYQFDTADDDNDAVVTDSACTHGTNVAAIAAGTQGVAADADLMILKVFSDDPTEAGNLASGHLCTFAYDTDINEALDLVALEVQGGAEVAAVNLSLGGGSFSSACTTSTSAAFATLVGAGVGVVVAAGNDGFSGAVNYPACDPLAFTVAATFDAVFASIGTSICTDAPTVVDNVTCWSNGGSLVDIAAPGSLILAGGLSMMGTSQAAPHVAGAFASLRAEHPTATVAALQAAMIASPTLSFDSDAAMSYPRLDLAHALAQLSTSPEAAADVATVSEGASTTVDVLANDTDPDGAPTYLSHTVTIESAPTSGVAAVTATGISYTHNGTETTSDSFVYEVCDPTPSCDTATVSVTVTAVNDAPTLSDVAAQEVDEDENTGALAFTIGDAETAATSLVLSRSSSNTTLVPTANIVFGGSGENRTVTVTPTANASGTATITLTVSDGTASASDTFILTVQAVNDPPTITNITDRATNEDTATAAINFNVGDAETAVGSLTVTATSSDTTVVPLSNLALSGTTAARTLIATPAGNQHGTTTISVSVSDGLQSTTDTFVLTVTSVNDAPTISNVPNTNTNEDTATAAIGFTLADVDDDVANLVVSATSSNATLIPTSRITFAGTGASRTVVFDPAANQSGTSTITLTVSDGNNSGADTLILTVAAVPDAPTISAVLDTTINEDTNTGALAVTVGDAETAAGSLTLSASSDNATLLPPGALVLGGAGANRTLTVTPAAASSGTATITLEVSDGTLTATDSFVLTVTGVNDPPTVSNLGNVTISEDQSTSALAFTLGDEETAVGDLLVTGSSTNTTLLPPEAYSFAGTGTNRTLTLSPAANQNGSATVTVSVSDGATTTSDTFVLTVTAVNDTPTISAVSDSTIAEDGTTGALSFTVADVETAASVLAVTRTSSNTTLLPVANLLLGGSGGSRTITATPVANRSGTATITLTVSDGPANSSTSFVVTVDPVNDAPTLSSTTDRTINEDATTGSITVTVADPESAAAALVLSGTSSNQSLVPDANIAISGTTGNRTVVVSPVANGFGMATITLQVSDGVATTSDAFDLTVTAVNDTPTIASIAAVNTFEDVPPAPIAVTIGDGDGGLDSLIVTATSSNQSLLPNASCVLGGTGGDRTLSLTPALDRTGTSNVTVTVSDGVASANRTFAFTVAAVEDTPSITPIADQSLAEDAATGPLAFTVADAETAANSLVVTASSSDTAVVAPAGIVLAGTGSNRTVSVTPLPNMSGTTTITLSVSDATGAGSTSFLVDVAAVNDVPTVAGLAGVETLEDTASAPGSFTIGDVESDPASLVVTTFIVDPSRIAAAQLAGEGATRTLVVEPVPDAFGLSDVVLTVDDGTDTATLTVPVDITPVNDAPTFVGLSDLSGPEDGPPLLGAFEVRDIDDDLDSLLLTAVGDAPTILTPDGTAVTGTGGARTLELSPEPDAFGTVLITLSADDGEATTEASLTVTIDAVPDAPVAVDDAADVPEGQALILDLLGNDYDVDSALSWTNITVTVPPAHGTLSPGPLGMGYEHDGTETVADSFAYRLNDGGLDSAEAWVLLTVSPRNDAPVAQPDALAVQEGGTGVVDVVANDSDAEGALDPALVVVTLAPQHGVVSVVEGGLSYVHDGSEGASDFFAYAVSDGVVGSAPAVVTVTISPVDDAPVAVTDIATVDEAAQSLIPVLANDSDAEAALDYTLVEILSAPIEGTVTVTDAGVLYEHGGGESIADHFSYRVSDGSLVSGEADVWIEVVPVYDVPTAVADEVEVDEGGTVTVEVLANDHAPEALPTVVITDAPTNGSAVASPDGTVDYVHDGSETVADSFSYRLDDPMGSSAEVEVSVTITAVNDAPIAADDSAAVVENRSVDVEVLANDTDADSLLDGSGLSIVAGGTNGSCAVVGTTLRYSPAVDVVGPDQCSYEICDADGACAQASLILDVLADNDGDSVADVDDTDDDGDGWEDAAEGAGDNDGDGLPNNLDGDSDGDGTPDEDQGGDNDGDGSADFLDVDDEDGPQGDTDGDSLSNIDEGALGTDPTLPDTDGDGRDDDEEVGDVATPTDSDGDSVIDARDEDDDGDGIDSVVEDGLDADGDGEPDEDADGDGVRNALDDDSDGDGHPDDEERTFDTDGDGIPNVVDEDSDGDGRTDIDEGFGDDDGDAITNILDADDGDGPDADPDGDGRTNEQEVADGSDPYVGDTDGDGLDDGEEADLGTDPTDEDSDGDGLGDGDEIEAGSNPLALDSDGDGIADGEDPPSEDTGCQSSVAGRGLGSSGAAVLIAALVALRRRRPSRHEAARAVVVTDRPRELR